MVWGVGGTCALLVNLVTHDQSTMIYDDGLLQEGKIKISQVSELEDRNMRYETTARLQDDGDGS